MSNLNLVGVLLGSNDVEVQVSANALKNVEIDRLKVSPKFSTKLNNSQLDDDEADAIHDGQLLSHLVGEVSEVGLDEDCLGS